LGFLAARCCRVLRSWRHSEGKLTVRMDGGGGDRMDVDVDDKSAGGGPKRRGEGDGPHKDPSSVLPPSPRRRGRGMPKLQLFDLVAGGAFERALEGM
ncbi:unnamed protein product, partial [Ectocarpus sp. 12 AP-2014]